MRVTLLVVLALPLAAQHLSLGVVAGGSVTDGFQDVTELQPQGTNTIHAYSQAKDLVIGPSLEVAFDRRWSLEVDALFRQLHLTQVFRITGGGVSSGSTPVVTWEIPVLAKYRLPGKRLRPFVEGGAALRTTGNLNATNPSHVGFTVGGGVEAVWHGLKIAPTVRYTHWQADDPRYRPTQSAGNQIELLAGFSSEASSFWRPLGHAASIGVVFATNLTVDGRTSHVASGSPGFLVDIDNSFGRKLIVGPSLEFRLPRSFSLEIDALYRPYLRIQDITFTYSGPASPSFPQGTQENGHAIKTWDFPILAKYQFDLRRWRAVHPFIGAGPDLRRVQQLVTASPYGAVAAAGVNFKLWHATLSPSIRYERWGRDSSAVPEVHQNQAEVLVGVSF